ncbi:NAD-dependent epimerase/dehydratase family protein [Microlunatus parietis]|uniref:Nucleoside-diphosphate-sugar epimerase n=1 Tax=Microlunatus parietis TaxID=682979 RepID=A0A7Y9IAC2_9ACTN|nr:NAD(P)-dependent oxidoreductase [Microlunatus parietis]NYE73137.1 nucleoside-diphosphate-sugar epimerase [Microlunatus parietis]
MKVLVAGATGVVGRRLVPMLLEQGHQVVGMIRSSRADDLAALGAEIVSVDALDASAVLEAVRKAEPEAIVHQLTALSGASMRNFDRGFARTNELRTTGTDNLLAAAKAVGVGRFVAQSYTNWTNDPNGPAVQDETAGLDPNPIPTQRQTLAGIAYLERVVPEAGGVVLRYGNFYGPGTHFSPGAEYEKLIRSGGFPIIGGGTGIWSFIHVDDAATAAIAALDHRAPGIYNVVDDEPAPVAEWLPELARELGAKPPRRVPTWLGRLLAGPAVAHLSTRVRGSSNAKAKAELGWTPRYASWRDGFRHGRG